MIYFKYQFLAFVLFIFWKPTFSNLNIHRSFANDPGAQADYLQQDTLLTKEFRKTTFVEDNANYTTYSRHEAAGYALFSACLVGLTGIVPLFVLPSFKNSELTEESECLLYRYTEIYAFIVDNRKCFVF